MGRRHARVAPPAPADVVDLGTGQGFLAPHRRADGRPIGRPLDDVDAAVAAHYQRLSPGQRRAIDRLLADTRYGALVSPAELGRAVGVHPSVLTRAAQTLGFRGFPDLQARLRAGLLHVVRAAPPSPDDGNPHAPEATALRVMAEDADSVRATVAGLTPEALAEIVHTLIAARRVYIFGARGAHGLAILLGMGLGLLLPDTRVLRQDFGDLADQVVGLEADDALVAIGFQKVDRVTADLLRWATDHGALTIGITDHRAGPVARATRQTLFVQLGAQHQIPSYPAAGVSLVNALATAVGIRTRWTASSQQTWEEQR